MLDVNLIISSLIMVISSVIFGKIIIDKNIQIKNDKLLVFIIIMTCSYVVVCYFF